MLNDKGRKVVKERIGDQMNSHEHYRNIREEDAHHFDQQWGQMSSQLGLGTSTANNRLGYGGGSYYGIDDDRRGAFNMNTHSISGPDAYRKRDIERTIIAPRVNNNAHLAMQPLQASGPPAITNGNHAPV